MKKEILKSPPFLIALFLLLLNDFALKAAFHNWLTGKLSDFAGLFVFVLFWTAFFPRYKKQLFFATALSFVIWKSPLSMPFIEFWNNNFYKIDRVIDYSDLIALTILPFAYYYSENKQIRIRRDFQTAVICVVSLFAFCATSKKGVITHYDDTYIFTAPPIDVESFLASHGSIHLRKQSIEAIEFWLEYASDTSARFRYDSSTIDMRISRVENKTILVLEEMTEQYSPGYHIIGNDHFFFDDMLIHAKELGFIEKKEPFGVIIALKNIDGLVFMMLGIYGFILSLFIAFIGAVFNKKRKPFFKLVATKIALAIISCFIIIWCAMILVHQN